MMLLTRWVRVVVAAALSTGMLIPLVTSARPAAAADAPATITGHGYGHGRGLGQWGAYGYARDHGWGFAQILAHYYGGTTLSSTDSTNPTISVELTALTGSAPVVAGAGLSINGTSVGAAAVMIGSSGSSLQVYTGPGCSGPWTAWGAPVSSGAMVYTTDSMMAVCTSSEERTYRGALRVYGGSTMHTQNLLPIETYLRGVVPREMPASWGSSGGIEALKAQAVAARSYALAYGSTASGATICDSTTCQVYGGAYVQPWGSPRTALESSTSDQAVVATANQVLRRAGAVVKTEYTSSTGGWSAGGQFPAVQDEGDSISPYHSWTVSSTLSAVAAKLGTGEIRTIAVTARNGLGDDGGRVTTVTVVTTAGTTTTFTGAQVRTKLGLRSDWFSISAISEASARSVVRALYNDVLGRAPDAAGEAYWTARVTATGDPGPMVDGIVMSRERLQAFVTAQYASALNRAPESGGLEFWIGYLSDGAGVPQLQSAIYGSSESLSTLGGGDVRTWFAAVYQKVLGRAATAADLDYWVGYANTYGRDTAVRWIVTSPESGLLRLNAYYQTFLGRNVDPSGVASWLPLMAERGDFVLPRLIGTSPEYWTNAQVRFP